MILWKKYASRLGAAAAVGVLTLAGAGCSGVVGGQTKTLSLSMPRSENHSLSLVMKSWAEDIEKGTDGQLTFNFNYDSALCPAGDAVSCIGDGRADAGQSSPAWEPAKFPLTRVAETGFVSSDVAAVTKAINALAQENEDLQAEYVAQNQKLLFFTVLNPLVVATAEKLDSLADLDKMSLRTSGTWPKIVAPLGVSPVNMPQTEQYEGVQRGVIDGVISTLDGSLEGSLFEVAPYYAAIGEYVGATTLATFTMNKDVYDGLTDEQRRVVDEASKKAADTWYTDFQGPENQKVCDGMLKNGATVTSIGTPAESAPWLATAKDSVWNGWKAEAAAKTSDPDALLERFGKLVQQNLTPAGSGPINGVQLCVEKSA